jgi:hypothetical protein
MLNEVAVASFRCFKVLLQRMNVANTMTCTVCRLVCYTGSSGTLRNGPAHGCNRKLGAHKIGICNYFVQLVAIWRRWFDRDRFDSLN